MPRHHRPAHPAAPPKSREPHLDRRRARYPVALPLMFAFCTLGAVSTFTWTIATTLGRDATRLSLTQPPLPAGESHYGEPLPARHPFLQPAVFRPQEDGGKASGAAARPAPTPASAALSLRRQCAWGKPGGNPYQGTLEQALEAARLPTEVVQEIAGKVATARVDDQLVISNAGIRGLRHGREFEPHSFAMTYGHTLCLDTRVNFQPGHVERADLYEATDRSGQRYAVMVPEVCGNVSVLSESGRRRALGQTVADGGGAGGDGRQTLAMAPSGDEAQAVPEPGTLWIAALALAVGAWVRRRQRSG